MWHPKFADRLESWSALRTRVEKLPTDQALQEINSWWFKAPWQPYYLHWDDQAKWPDPWQLLSDNVFCEVARGLGILYTISMIDHPVAASADLVLTSEGTNLVLVAKEKYVLNWEDEVVVNTHQKHKIKKKLAVAEVKKYI